jgi:hypothetical protein
MNSLLPWSETRFRARFNQGFASGKHERHQAGMNGILHQKANQQGEAGSCTRELKAVENREQTNQAAGGELRPRTKFIPAYAQRMGERPDLCQVSMNQKRIPPLPSKNRTEQRNLHEMRFGRVLSSAVSQHRGTRIQHKHTQEHGKTR